MAQNFSPLIALEAVIMFWVSQPATPDLESMAKEPGGTRSKSTATIDFPVEIMTLKVRLGSNNQNNNLSF